MAELRLGHFARYLWLIRPGSPMSDTDRQRVFTLSARRNLAMDQLTSIDDELTEIFHKYDPPRPVKDNPQA